MEFNSDLVDFAKDGFVYHRRLMNGANYHWISMHLAIFMVDSFVCYPVSGVYMTDVSQEKPYRFQVGGSIFLLTYSSSSNFMYIHMYT